MRDIVMHRSGLEIDLQAPAGSGEQILRAILRRQERPRTKPGELLCLRHGGDLYLQDRDGVVVACHWQGTGTLPRHTVALMSQEHRVQADYLVRAAEGAGLAVRRELTLPTKVRPDVVIESSAFEVQRSQLTVAQAKGRTTKAVRGGMSVSLWMSDKDPKYSPLWLGRVPSVRIWASDWMRLPSEGSAQVIGGLRRMVPTRCPPHGEHCLLDGRGRCQGWHLEHLPLGSSELGHSHNDHGLGRAGLPLDRLAVGVAVGDYVPVQFGKWVLVIESSEAEKYGLNWAAAPARRSAIESEDARRIECQAAPLNPLPTCCGHRRAGHTSQPILPECMLCPRSATYWRLGCR